MSTSTKNPSERPIIKKAKILEDTSSLEAFQNVTLRPIIKMKHDLIIAHFIAYLIAKNVVFRDLSKEKKINYIESALSQDNILKGEYRGIILSQLSKEEYQLYVAQPKDFNKRINSMITKRLVDQLEELH